MIWPLRTFFSLLLAALPLAPATVSGRVVLEDSKDKRVRQNRDYSGVAIWLEPIGAAPEIHPKEAAMVQKDKMFTPHVLVIPVGSAVEFPNYDPIFHNAFSNFAGQLFDVGLYPPGSSRTVTFRRAGVVRVFCNIHPSMSAVIAVVPSSYYDTSKSTGSFQMNGVVPGEYTIKFFHERSSEETLIRLSRRLTIADDTSLPEIRISETGYLPMPHTNKFGHEYPPGSEGRAGYPGAR